MPAAAAELAALQRLLDGSTWLGAEVDLSYRVLALTVEPLAWPDGAALPDDGDRRLQVLLSPASTIAASLRVELDPPRVESFEVEQLPDVVAAMDGPVLRGQMLGTAQPGKDIWPATSMAGRSNAPDGHVHRILVEAASGARRLGVFATFDDVEVRSATQEAVALH